MPLKKKDEYIPIKCEGWNGKFVYSNGAANNVSKVRRHNQNVTDTSNFYGYSTEPIILPVSWDGTFAKSGETRIQPERNRSDDTEYFQYNTEPTVLPTQWNGEFQLDPNDIRIKPERNHSDPRDYAEASRFKRVS
ncbi:PREDICTED: uncharacterized protein LOC108966122 [Bactrocera latifrons]|uniref:Uncharacterized protein n=1 Tax=Bactrocera latifrons TaxID=174628 RepID=A0A0K8UYX3_BACLA|nr:PREDICTED: uncharacterized protein LOC108966122 [Bactrocera latifrons]